MSNDDELNRIEEEKGQRDLGIFGYRIYQGAISEGATASEAVGIVAAFFEGTARGQTGESK